MKVLWEVSLVLIQSGLNPCYNGIKMKAVELLAIPAVMFVLILVIMK